VSWATDENISTWWTPLDNVTLRNSISSEALWDSGHPKGGHSMGFLIGDGSKNITVHGNLFAHNAGRNPLAKGDTTSEVINNVVYNNKWYATQTAGPMNYIGNKYIVGADKIGTRAGLTVSSGPGFPERSVYVKDNLGFYRTSSSQPEWDEVTGDERYQASSPYVTPSGITAVPASQVENYVFRNAGARPADRDAVDIRVINSVRNRTGRIIDNPGQVGGWPNLAQNTRRLTTPSDPNGDEDGDGYTNLEEWLHGYARQVEGS
jgi:pectate lyase